MTRPKPTPAPAEESDANRFQFIVLERLGPMPGSGDDWRENDLTLAAAALTRLARVAGSYGMSFSDLMQLAVMKLPAGDEPIAN